MPRILLRNDGEINVGFVRIVIVTPCVECSHIIMFVNICNASWVCVLGRILIGVDANMG